MKRRSGSLGGTISLDDDHKRLTFRFQGRDFRLIDVHAELVQKIFA